MIQDLIASIKLSVLFPSVARPLKKALKGTRDEQGLVARVKIIGATEASCGNGPKMLATFSVFTQESRKGNK